MRGVRRPGRIRTVASLWLAALAGAGAEEPRPSTSPVQGQVIQGYLYPKPGPVTFIKRLPGDLKDYTKGIFRKEALPAWAWVGLTTGILLAADQRLVDKAYDLGDQLGLSHSSGQRTYGSLKTPLGDLKFQFPHDFGSALYFIGDGYTHFTLAAGFLSYGAAKSDNRALQTSSQIAESVFASGAVVQLLKHITGRESPFVATVPGGRWRFFPNQVDYSRNVPRYDAFPAGHISASMATLTVISHNYPEYRWIRPLGYTLIGLLSFQMMNNGVHWASDYPLGFALGYGFGWLAVDKGRSKVGQVGLRRVRVLPLSPMGGLGLAVRIPF